MTPRWVFGLARDQCLHAKKKAFLPLDRKSFLSRYMTWFEKHEPDFRTPLPLRWALLYGNQTAGPFTVTLSGNISANVNLNSLGCKPSGQSHNFCVSWNLLNLHVVTTNVLERLILRNCWDIFISVVSFFNVMWTLTVKHCMIVNCLEKAQKPLNS